MSDTTATTLHAREPWLDVSHVFVLARKEMRDALRNKWFVLYSIAFAALALGLSSLAMAGTGDYGFGGFGRTAASLINLVMLIVPLMALTAGAGSLAGERERGTLAYLLALPISRLEVLLGKYLGLAIALAASLALGFGACAATIAIRAGGADASAFLKLVALAYGLALAMLSVGMVISVMARRTSVALAAALFTWLALVFLGDLVLMGSTLTMRLDVPQMLTCSMVNPLQVFKMASVTAMHASLDVLGPAGLYATQHWGSRLPWLFTGILAAWIVLPLVAAQCVFIRRGGA